MDLYDFAHLQIYTFLERENLDRNVGKNLIVYISFEIAIYLFSE